ncbi:hypothetical protein B9G98_04364 [Wickerhamiella sorbophila]|uniref:Uncharacterized protein n=1 Tax=Wickerhamiella sorbophila TaxID=45607 RepID=A0A2T0FP31_9ASCO|nr:hypothetical protein B9G98_04364 [Wickerhamiella sorbophila]PRT56744.1 hypothetical protein B9G98_04364 [Wickerhamiella sorbophila]
MVMELLVTDVGRVLLDDNVGTDALLGIVEELLVNDVGREVFESPGAFDDNTGDKELLVIISELFVNDVGRELDELLEIIVELFVNDVGREVFERTDAFDDSVGSDVLLKIAVELFVNDVDRGAFDDKLWSDALLGIVADLLLNDVRRELFDDSVGRDELPEIVAELLVNDVCREVFDDSVGSDALLGTIAELLVDVVDREVFEDNVGCDSLLRIVAELLVNDVGEDVFEDSVGSTLLEIVAELLVNDVGNDVFVTIEDIFDDDTSEELFSLIDELVNDVLLEEPLAIFVDAFIITEEEFTDVILSELLRLIDVFANVVGDDTLEDNFADTLEENVEIDVFDPTADVLADRSEAEVITRTELLPFVVVIETVECDEASILLALIEDVSFRVALNELNCVFELLVSIDVLTLKIEREAFLDERSGFALEDDTLVTVVKPELRLKEFVVETKVDEFKGAEEKLIDCVELDMAVEFEVSVGVKDTEELTIGELALLTVEVPFNTKEFDGSLETVGVIGREVLLDSLSEL